MNVQALFRAGVATQRGIFTLALAVSLALPAKTLADERAKLVYISNMPEIASRPGLAEAAGLITELRAAGAPVYLIHGGDSLAPSTLSPFDRGAHMVALLNAIDPVAFGVAKREFAYGEDELTLRTFEAAFPMISNNLFDPATGGDLEGLTPSTAFRVADRRICVTAAVSTAVATSYLPKRVTAADPIASTRVLGEQLRGEGCDLIIALFGELVEEQRSLLEDGSVDLVISAASLATPEVQDGERGTWITMDASDPRAVIIELGGASESCLICDVRLHTLDDGPRDPKLAALIETYSERLTTLLASPVATTATPLDTRRYEVRSRETAFGNLVADALRTAADAQIALINSGGIRGDRVYAAGTTLTRGDLQKELPFRNRVTVVALSGAQLLETLESAMASYEDYSGGFPQVSGMTVRFDSGKAAGERIVALTVNGEPLREETIYTMATVDFLTRGGDGYEPLTRARTARAGVNALLSEALRSYLSTRDTVAPVVEGRIIDVRE